VASDDGASVRLFDARTGGEASKNSSSSNSSSSSFVALLTPPSPAPRCAAISLAWCPGKKSENLIAVGSDADFVSFFDASSGKLLALLPPPSPGVEVNEAVFSSDGTVFARAVGTHGAVELFSVEELLEKAGGGGGSSSEKGGAPPPSSASDWKGFRCPVKPFATLHGHTSTVFALSTVAAAASATGGAGEGNVISGPSSFLLASGGADGACVVWDLRYGSPLATCGAFDHQVKSVSLGGGWNSSQKSPSGSRTTCGNLIAFAGESDTIVVDDWTLSPATGNFLPARSPTTPLSRAAANPRPYPFRVFVPRVESVAWAPAVLSGNESTSSSAPSAAAAGSSSENENPSSSSKRSQQSNVGALAFVRCIPAGGGGGAQQQLLQGGGGGRVAGGEVVGAVGLFAPPPSASSSSR